MHVRIAAHRGGGAAETGRGQQGGDALTVRRLLFALAVAGGGRPAVAQVSVHATLGARYTSTLVHDSIVDPIDVRPAIGPAFSISASEQSKGTWTPDAGFDVSWASLQRHEGSSSTKINSLTTVAFTVGVRHDVARGLSVRVGIGGLKYLPSDKSGLFRDGSGIAVLGTLGFDWAPTQLQSKGFGLSLRYDAHRFTTTALKTEGFTSPRLVHRVSLGVRARIIGQ